jgi:type IV pilus assembly protein PilM
MASFFSKLFSSQKGGSVLGIDIGSSAIKVVQLKKKGGQVILETYGSLALGPYGDVEIGRSPNLQPDKVSEALIDVLRESHVTTNQAGLAMPYGASLISMAELPQVAESELAQIVPFEARKYIPVPLTEVMLDWMIIPKANEPVQPPPQAGAEGQVAHAKTIDVLLVAIHNETLARYQSITSKAALEISFFEIEAFGDIRSVLDQGLKTEMIIDFGAATTKVYIVERGIIRTPHIINRGSQDITMALSQGLGISVQDAEIIKRDLAQVPAARQKDVNTMIGKALEPVFSEVNQVLVSYQKKFNKDVAKCHIIGGGARLANLLPYAESQIRTEVALGNPFSKTVAPAFLDEVLRSTGPEFAGAIGIALRKLQEQG